jgi:hypothetical protein
VELFKKTRDLPMKFERQIHMADVTSSYGEIVERYRGSFRIRSMARKFCRPPVVSQSLFLSPETRQRVCAFLEK